MIRQVAKDCKSKTAAPLKDRSAYGSETTSKQIMELRSTKTKRAAKTSAGNVTPTSSSMWTDSVATCNNSYKTRQLYVYMSVDSSDEGITSKRKSQPHKCSYCIKRFSRKDVLREHERLHTQERPYVCQFCSSTFPTQSRKKKHERTHFGEKRVSCVHCGLCFSGRPSLHYHLKVHAGIRPFKCKLCKKKFYQKSQLNRHAFVHSDQKRFICDECGAKFKSKSSLGSHMRKHNGNALFKCLHCSKLFYAQESFNYHLKAHANDRAFPCSICGSAFLRSGHLRRHTSKVHNDQSVKKCQKRSLRNVKTMKQDKRSYSSSVAISKVGHSKARRRAYSCTYCPQNFFHIRGLESHLTFHAAVGAANGGEFLSPLDENNNIDDSDNSNVKNNVGNDISEEDILPVQLMCEVLLESDNNHSDSKTENSTSTAPKRRSARIRGRRST